jgi:hypothetical protein
VPPHLRNGAAAAAATTAAAAGRSLDELAPHNMLIKVQYTKDGPFSFDGCPDNIAEEAVEKQQQDSADAELSGTAAQLAVSTYMQAFTMLLLTNAITLLAYVWQLDGVDSTAPCCKGRCDVINAIICCP